MMVSQKVGIMEPLRQLIITTMLTSVTAKNILMLPRQFPSLTMANEALGNALMDLGHEVTIVLPPSIPTFERISQGRLNVIAHKVTGPDLFNNKTRLTNLFEEASGKYTTDIIRYTAHDLAYYSMDLLRDEETMSKLKSMKFDLVVVDLNMVSRLLLLVPYVLDVPYITFGSQREEWSSRNVGLPSHVPFLLGTSYTEKMTFWERLDNTFQMISWELWPDIWYNEQRVVQELVPGCEYTLEELFRRSWLFMIDTDMLMDYPRPVMPNEVLIGGITIKPPKPLPNDLQEWIGMATHGVIVMSFGSAFHDIQTHLFTEVLRRVKQRVVWRYFGEPTKDIPDNVKLMSWLPQQDILAHENTKLFITHCGNRGQHEALYHGVPMVGLPLYSDQMYNAKRMEYRGYGVSLDQKNLTVENILGAINEVLANPTYAQNIKKASEILQARPMLPAQKAAQWVDHVLTYGADHLIPYSLKMPAYQLLMVDIAAFGLLIAVLGITSLFFGVKIITNKCQKNEKVKHE